MCVSRQVGEDFLDCQGIIGEFQVDHWGWKDPHGCEQGGLETRLGKDSLNDRFDHFEGQPVCVGEYFLECGL